LFRKIGTFIVHSKAHKRIIEKFNPSADVLKLFLPVNDLLYQRIDRNLARKKLGLKGNVLLFFGYVREDKGLNYLISALYKVVKQMQATLLIAGEFSGNKRKYVKQIRALGLNDSVKIIDGYLPNKEAANCFSAADVILTPYIFDIPSGIISAAYAFGKPVIITNLPSLAEYIQNGKTGYVVPTRDSDSLAEAIVEYFKKNRSKEFQKMIKIKKKELSCENYCRQLLKAIEQKSP
jgi:glycosyltransferase involved in cell wall biosynthesis